MSEKRIFARRLWMSLAGVVLTALAVAMFKTAALGVDPFQSFVSGMDAVLPISYGTVYSAVNIVLLCKQDSLDRGFVGPDRWEFLALLWFLLTS